MYKREIDNSWDFKTSNTKEFTHCYHTYPAMMIPQVARKLICDYSPEGKLNLLFDPYMGSGTSLVEASITGINSIGTDINPLARLMSKVKSTHFDQKVICDFFSVIQSELPFYSPDKVTNRDFDRISNYSYWYSEDNLLKLSFITQLIADNVDELYKDFFNVCLSETVREVSFTRNGEFKRFRMKEDKIENFKPDVFRLFEEKMKRNIQGLEAFNRCSTGVNASIFDFNTTYNIPKEILPDESVDMVVTSPPYGDSRTTVAYGQFSRWANEWFGFDNAKTLDKHLMGGLSTKEIKFESLSIKPELDQIAFLDNKRFYEVVSFLNDYWFSIQNVAKTVRSGGRVCYVVGNRRVKDVQINLDYFTAEMFEKCGFKHDITIIREIPNKRMPSKTSPTNKSGAKVSTMSNEYIVILTKQ